MAYGANILSTIPADWDVTNGTMTSGKLSLSAGGSALLNITLEMIDKLPETAEVTLVADHYGTDLRNRIDIIGVLSDNTFISHQLPIVDVGNGIFKTIIAFPEEAYSSFIFKINSKEGIEITEWSMATPVSADFTEVIDGVKQEIPKLLWDYNTLEFQIGQEECTVGMISAKLSKNGDLQGHLQINFTASENSVIVVRIFDNEIQELYSPIEFVVKRGRNSLGIPHSYIGRKIGIHNFLVTMQVKTGTVTVETRGFLYTIDGGYLAQRILDVGYEVHDITIKQLPTDMDPSEIYAVCIDDGKALIRKRVYNEEVAVAWVPEYIIEDAVEACIEFNGLWILRDGEIGFTLETDEQPYVMWIDPEGILWSQHGPDVTTKFQMATGVSYMSCCMSYNYAPDIQYDQGLMCVYLKSGLVYYKNLCRQDLTGTMVWSAERELPLLGSGNTLVSVARLNDYRCAINAINSKSQWLISDRGYVGQAVRSEHFYYNSKLSSFNSVTVTPITASTNQLEEESFHYISKSKPHSITVLYGDKTLPTITPFTFVGTEWITPNSVRLVGSHRIILHGDVLDNFRASTVTRKCTIVSVSQDGPDSLLFTIAENLSALETMDIQTLGRSSMHYEISDAYLPVALATTCAVYSPVLTKHDNFAYSSKKTMFSLANYTLISAAEVTTPDEGFNYASVHSAFVGSTYTQVGATPI